MKVHDATEQAYKNGYEAGKRDARKKGQWVQIGYDKAMDRITCSCCLEYFNILDNNTEDFNFCPNCGSDMRGEEDG